MSGKKTLARKDGGALEASWLDRFLGLFTDVHPGEGRTALLLALDVCLLLTAYYVLKPVREALILTGSGAEMKSYASVGQVALLSLLMPAYSWLVNRVPRDTLIRTVTFVFAGCLGLFYLGARVDLPGLGIAFFLWIGVFNLMIVAQFWALATDLYSRDQGERLFPVVALGASLGAVFGSQLTSLLVERLGVAQMLLVGAGLLLATLAVMKAIEHSFERMRPEAEKEKEDTDKGDEKKKADADKSGGFQLVLRSPYLRWLAVLMLLANLVNSTGEYLLGSLVEEASKSHPGEAAEKFVGHFYSTFFFWVNLVGAAIQLLVAPRLIKHLGVRVALLVLPLIALGGYAVMALVPVLGIVRFSKVAENATDYSLQSTVKNALFLPLSVAEKYKAKQVIDTICVRTGDVLSALVVFVGLRFLDLPTAGFAWFNAALAALWVFVAIRVGRSYDRKSEGRHSMRPSA